MIFRTGPSSSEHAARSSGPAVLVLTARQQALIFSEAEAAGALECCGLLIGALEDGAARVREVLPAQNVAEDRERAFEIDPRTLINAHRNARERGEAILGWYHSHPSGVALPSACDAERAVEPGKAWVIVAGRDMQAYVAVENGNVAGRFRRLPVQVISSGKTEEAGNGNG